MLLKKQKQIYQFVFTYVFIGLQKKQVKERKKKVFFLKSIESAVGTLIKFDCLTISWPAKFKDQEQAQTVVSHFFPSQSFSFLHSFSVFLRQIKIQKTVQECSCGLLGRNQMHLDLSLLLISFIRQGKSSSSSSKKFLNNATFYITTFSSSKTSTFLSTVPSLL